MFYVCIFKFLIIKLHNILQFILTLIYLNFNAQKILNYCFKKTEISNLLSYRGMPYTF